MSEQQIIHIPLDIEIAARSVSLFGLPFGAATDVRSANAECTVVFIEERMRILGANGAADSITA
jgi:hypothetical protein